MSELYDLLHANWQADGQYKLRAWPPIGVRGWNFSVIYIDDEDHTMELVNPYHPASTSTIGWMRRELNLTLQEEIEHMTLLIPDREREQREDFIWCVPIERDKWNKWYELSDKFKTITPEGVHYMNRMEGKKVRTILVMPNGSQSDDDVLMACAWLRLIKEFNCRMYVVRCTDNLPTAASMINNTAGCDPSLVENIENFDL